METDDTAREARERRERHAQRAREEEEIRQAMKADIIVQALTVAGIGHDAITTAPHGPVTVVTVTAADGSRVSLGETDTTHPDYDPANAGWIDATAYDADDNEVNYLGGPTLDGVVAQVVAWFKRTAE